jgi:hypothetical protein
MSIITKPIPNSTADRTRKKNVNDKKFTLSYKSPIDKDNTYKVIQSISAVSNKCRAVFTFTIIVTNIKKNIIEKRFRSPIYICYWFC